MALFSRLIFQVVRWKARRGLREDEALSPGIEREVARQTGIRGETYAYWYLRGMATCSSPATIPRAALKANSIWSVTTALHWRSSKCAPEQCAMN